MKKSKKYRVCRFIFMVFFISFLVVYFSELTGYYEYQNYKQATLTKEQIKKFEEDVANGKEVDITKYLAIEDKKYDNTLSKLTSDLSSGISDIVKNGVENTFKYLSKLVDE